MTARITVRQARIGDIPAIVALETAIYGPLGTAVFGEEHVSTWFKVFAGGILVAEHDGIVVGYKYSHLVHFGFDTMDQFMTYDEATDQGYTVRTHRPDGNALKGVSLCSALPGAGRALFAATFGLVRSLKLGFYFSFTRIAGFDRYMKLLENDQASPPDEDAAALWYAHACARAVGGRLWPVMPPCPDLALPEPDAPDPVLSKQLRFRDFGLAGMRRDCMRDPQSRNRAAFMVYVNPHSAA